MMLTLCFLISASVLVSCRFVTVDSKYVRINCTDTCAYCPSGGREISICAFTPLRQQTFQCFCEYEREMCDRNFPRNSKFHEGECLKKPRKARKNTRRFFQKLQKSQRRLADSLGDEYQRAYRFRKPKTKNAKTERGRNENRPEADEKKISKRKFCKEFYTQKESFRKKHKNEHFECPTVDPSKTNRIPKTKI